MCGIAGGIWIADPGPEPLEAALAMLHRRGPDHLSAQEWATPGFAVRLGATRLAVQDLSHDADQPMTSVDGRFTLAYNGEITNFIELRAELERSGVRFRSRGDTEVLLESWRAWGPDCLDRLEGMYALAILDREQRRLMLARDPFGIKPLFVAHEGGTSPHDPVLLFASELPSLLAMRPGRPILDGQAAVDYIATGHYDRGERTFIRGVRHAIPGTLLTIGMDADRPAIHQGARTWIPSLATTGPQSLDEAADAVRAAFLDSVQRNLRSDVPVGFALSGGIDSSAIVCAARVLAPDLDLRTFSFVSPGSPVDERRWIDEVVSATGARATMVQVGAGELLDDLDDLVLAQGEPFGSLSIYAQYRVFAAMRDAGIVVSLDGQGADELLAGYRGYPAARISSLLAAGHPVGALGHAVRWSRLPGASMASATGHLASAIGLDARVQRVRARRRGGRIPWRTAVLAERELRPTLAFPVGVPGAQTGAGPASGGLRLKAALRADLLAGDLAALLRHGDRNSMRFSVEGRVPFLDRGLVGQVLALPEHHLVDRAAVTKAVLRRAMRGLVPDAILDRRDKIGFEVPGDSWLEPAVFAGMVRSGPAVGILDTAGCADAIAAGRLSPATAWRMVNLSRWVALVDVDAS